MKTGFAPLSLALMALAISVSPIQPIRGGTWTTSGSMTTGRYAHTATLLSNGKVLVAGGLAAGSTSQSSAELYDPYTGVWTNAGYMSGARYLHTASLLQNGKVLIAGGSGDFGFPSGAQLYDPVSGSWSSGGTLNTTRYGHTATLLPNGQVLIAGGNNGSYLTSAELYNPSNNTWTVTGSLNTARRFHTATLLPNGKVLVAGGQGNGNALLNSAEIYDPNTGVWTNTGAMTIPHDNHTAMLLPDGKVLVSAGLTTSGVTNVAEIYDTTTARWTPTGKLNGVRDLFAATLLPDGTVLAECGIGNIAGGTNTVEIYNPNTGVWTKTNSLSTARYYPTATLLANGTVLVAGGIKNGTTYLTSTEVYDPSINPAVGVWLNAGTMTTNRSYHTATLLPDGKVLIAGGGGNCASAEIYDPIDGSYTNTGSLIVGRGRHTATLLPNGNVLVTGGFIIPGSYVIPIADAEIYEPSNKMWHITTSMTSPRLYHAATLLPNGKVLVTGGQNTNNAYLSSAEIFDPVAETWTSCASMPTNLAHHTATLLANGKVLVAGGETGASTNFSTLSSAALFDPGSGTWSTTSPMNTWRGNHTATLLPNGKVLVAGGDDMVSTSPTSSAGMGWSSAELFDLVTGNWTPTGSMSTFREFHTATLLPNGKVLVAGGGTYITNSDLYNPATGTWTATNTMLGDRFNNTATLLFNGKVLITGGQYPGGGYFSSNELYDPGLGYSNSWQPQITSATSPFNPGDSLAVTGAQFSGISEASGGNSQNSSTAYPLVQLRSLENGQITFLQTTNWSANSFASTAVWNFPPGWALATVFANGIQSTSVCVNIVVPAAAVSNVTGTATMNNGFQFIFTNHPGALMGMLMTTNLSLPLTNWTPMGGVMEIASGQFQFSDSQAVTNSQRFYRLFSP